MPKKEDPQGPTAQSHVPTAGANNPVPKPVVAPVIRPAGSPVEQPGIHNQSTPLPKDPEAQEPKPQPGHEEENP